MNSPHYRVGHTNHADQHDALEQPRLGVHVHDGGHAAKHGRAEEKVQEHLGDGWEVGGVMSGEVGAEGEGSWMAVWGVRWIFFYPVSVDEPLAARAGAEPLLAGVFQHVHQQGAVHLVGEVKGRVTLRRGRRAMKVIRKQQLQQRGGRGFTSMFWASTLAPAPSSTCTESTFPASTAQWSGVLRFSLSAALTEAWFLIRKLLGSVLGTHNHLDNQLPIIIQVLIIGTKIIDKKENQD